MFPVLNTFSSIFKKRYIRIKYNNKRYCSSIINEKITKINTNGKNVYSIINNGEDLSLPEYFNNVYRNPSKWKWSPPDKIKALKALFSKTPKFPSDEELDSVIEIVEPDMNSIYNPDPDKIQITWIGHSSFLIQIDGYNFLTDPVFSDRCTPIEFIGPKRFRRIPFTLKELPRIDFVVVSHNHYDHLEYKTVSYLKDSTVWCIPKGNGEWFSSNGVTNYIEFNWWDRFDFTDEFSVVFLPAQHWSKRTFDDNKTLWGGFSILGKHKKIYFAGDTGYNSYLFKEIGQKFGGFDISLIPIGAYEPNDFLGHQHVNPEEAVIIHKEIKSKKSIGIHWGTFVLTKEHVFDPLIKLKEAKIKHGLDENSFIVVKHGQVNKYDNVSNNAVDTDLEVTAKNMEKIIK